MSDEGKQGPHYISELDQSRSKHDPSGELIFVYYLPYIFSATLASVVFFNVGEKLLGFLMIGFGIGIVVLTFCISERDRKNGQKNNFAGKEKEDPRECEQSPHYILELDPKNPRHKKGFAPGMLGPSIVGGFASIIGAFIAWQTGIDKLMMFLIASGIVLLSPILMAASWW